MNLLQGKILLVIFGKILCLVLRGNSLQRIIAKASALVGGGHNAAFSANDLILADLSRKSTIGAVALDFLSEQHGLPPPFAPL